jgi:hypothetical protein
MKFRNLRIAWSVFWGLACVLLVVLWVRSYWRVDYFTYPFSSIEVESRLGILVISESIDNGQNWTWQSESISDLRKIGLRGGAEYLFAFQIKPAVVPVWFVLILLAALASLPWLRWRFSLRTLLIATTLVAVVLGLVVGAARN